MFGVESRNVIKLSGLSTTETEPLLLFSFHYLKHSELNNVKQVLLHYKTYQTFIYQSALGICVTRIRYFTFHKHIGTIRELFYGTHFGEHCCSRFQLVLFMSSKHCFLYWYLVISTGDDKNLRFFFCYLKIT